LRVVSPATPQDAYTMIRQAIDCPDPVLFFEPKARYWDVGEVVVGPPGVPVAGGLGAARVAAVGSEVTVVAYGPSLRVALAAAEAAGEDGRSVEVIDLRSLSPIDFDAIQASVEKTRRLIVVHEAPVFFGAGAEIVARITERCFYLLEAPVLRVGGFHLPYPPARVERDYLPGLDKVIDAIDRVLRF